MAIGNIQNALGSYASGAALGKTSGMDAREGGGADFAAMLKDKLRGAIQTQKTSEATAQAAVKGEADMADLISAVNDAEATLNVVVAIRDRLINAYETLLRMPV